MGTTPAPDLGRRALLAIAVAAPLPLLAACTGGSSTTPTGGPDDPDAAVRAAVAEDERALIAAYDQALAARPDLAGDLSALRDQHRAHLSAVTGEAGDGPAATGSVSTGAGTGDLAALARLERRAADRRTRACRDASSADLARLLALVAASEAAHAVALRGLS